MASKYVCISSINIARQPVAKMHLLKASVRSSCAENSLQKAVSGRRRRRSRQRVAAAAGRRDQIRIKHQQA